MPNPSPPASVAMTTSPGALRSNLGGSVEVSHLTDRPELQVAPNNIAFGCVVALQKVDQVGRKYDIQFALNTSDLFARRARPTEQPSRQFPKVSHSGERSRCDRPKSVASRDARVSQRGRMSPVTTSTRMGKCPGS